MLYSGVVSDSLLSSSVRGAMKGPPPPLDFSYFQFEIKLMNSRHLPIMYFPKGANNSRAVLKIHKTKRHKRSPPGFNPRDIFFFQIENVQTETETRTGRPYHNFIVDTFNYNYLKKKRENKEY